MTTIQHNAITGSDLHAPGYRQTSDPGVVGAGQVWVDTSASGTQGTVTLKSRNDANTGWDTLSSGYHILYTNVSASATSSVGFSDLMTYTIPAGQFIGSKVIRVRGWGDLGTSSTTKTIRFYVGAFSTLINSTVDQAGGWTAECLVFAQGPTSQSAITWGAVGNSNNVEIGNITPSAANPNTMTSGTLLRFQASGSNLGDVYQIGLLVEALN